MKSFLCAIGWHRWNGNRCEDCGLTRDCTATRHFWRHDVCEVCGSKNIGPAQIATFVHKIHHKRLDKSLPDWVTELTALGPIAIPAIVKELLEMFQEYSDLPTPAFTDLRNALENIGPAGAGILKEVTENTPDVPPKRAMYKPGQKEWINDLASEVLKKWENVSR